MAGPADEEMTTTEKVVGYIHISQEGCAPLYGGWGGAALGGTSVGGEGKGEIVGKSHFCGFCGKGQMRQIKQV